MSNFISQTKQMDYLYHKIFFIRGIHKYALYKFS